MITIQKSGFRSKSLFADVSLGIFEGLDNAMWCYAFATVIFAGALAPIIALKLLGDVDDANTTAVGIYVAIASVITIIAVLFAKETSKSSLRHDRVIPDAHA